MDEKLKTGTNYCECSGCGEYFGSVTPFDMHRAGPATERRCLTEKEMYELGMFRDDRGYWRSKPRDAA